MNVTTAACLRKCQIFKHVSYQSLHAVGFFTHRHSTSSATVHSEYMEVLLLIQPLRSSFIQHSGPSQSVDGLQWNRCTAERAHSWEPQRDNVTAVPLSIVLYIGAQFQTNVLLHSFCHLRAVVLFYVQVLMGKDCANTSYSYLHKHRLSRTSPVFCYCSLTPFKQ